MSPFSVIYVWSYCKLIKGTRHTKLEALSRTSHHACFCHIKHYLRRNETSHRKTVFTFLTINFSVGVCTYPQFPENGDFIRESCNDDEGCAANPGKLAPSLAVIKYRCKDGYNLRGEETRRTCIPSLWRPASGTWIPSAPAPHCSSNVPIIIIWIN